MIAFDTDVIVEILKGSPIYIYVARAAAIPRQNQFVPSVVIEEILRGRLNAIRRAEAGKARLTVDRAYALFEATFSDFRTRRMLPYSTQAEIQFQAWRQDRRGVTNGRYFLPNSTAQFEKFLPEVAVQCVFFFQPQTMIKHYGLRFPVRKPTKEPSKE